MSHLVSHFISLRRFMSYWKISCFNVLERYWKVFISGITVKFDYVCECPNAWQSKDLPFQFYVYIIKYLYTCLSNHVSFMYVCIYCLLLSIYYLIFFLWIYHKSIIQSIYYQTIHPFGCHLSISLVKNIDASGQNSMWFS